MSSDDSKPSRKQSPKKEEEGCHDEKNLNSMVGEKKGIPSANFNANANPSNPIPKVKEEEAMADSGKKLLGRLVPSKVKYEETEDDDDDDKPIARRAVVFKAEKKISVKKKVKEEDTKKVGKVEVKKRKTNATAVTGAEEQNGKKREKKVYDLPGQKRDPPEERDPLRIFYETLFNQIPHSGMAQFWMMESGLLPREEAKKVFEKKQKLKLVSPAKSTGSTPKKTVSSTVSSKKKTTEVKVSSKQSKKRKSGDGSSDNDSDNDIFLASRVTKRQKAFLCF